MRRAVAAIAVLAVAGLPLVEAASGCDAFSLSPTRFEAAADAGNGTFYVNGPPGCSYALGRTESWLSVGQDAATVRDGSVPVNVYWEASTDSRGREAFVSVTSDGPEQRGAWVIVVQAPPLGACVRSVAPTVVTFPAEGGTQVVVVDAATDCGWAIGYQPSSWWRMPYGSHDGPQEVPITAEANDGGPRRGVATVAGQTITIDQESITGERPGSGRTGTGNPVEDAAADWVGANEEPGPEAAAVLVTVAGAAVLLRRRPG